MRRFSSAKRKRALLSRSRWGFILLNAFTFIAGSVIVALIDAGVLYFVTKVFQREKILTQWK